MSNERETRGADSCAAPCSAWIHQPTCSGWWWWEKSETPIFVEPITNGRREQLGLGADLPKLGIKRCADMAGRWAGPIVKPASPNTPDQRSGETARKDTNAN